MANRIGYPVLVRPSYVLGGRAMQIVHNDEELRALPERRGAGSARITPVLGRPATFRAKSVEVDAICDGERRVHPGHHGACRAHRRALAATRSAFTRPTLGQRKGQGHHCGLHRQAGAGRSASRARSTSSSSSMKTRRSMSSRSIRARRRTVPFLSKATGVPMANIATKIALGQSLKDQGYGTGVAPEKKRWYVKAPVF